jgi:predicted transcriptional regulator
VPRPKSKKLEVRLSVSLDTDDHVALLRLAEEHRLSISWMVRKAIAEFVERNRDSDQAELPLSRSRQNDEGRAA